MYYINHEHKLKIDKEYSSLGLGVLLTVEFLFSNAEKLYDIVFLSIGLIGLVYGIYLQFKKKKKTIYLIVLPIIYLVSVVYVQINLKTTPSLAEQYPERLQYISVRTCNEAADLAEKDFNKNGLSYILYPDNIHDKKLVDSLKANQVRIIHLRNVKNSSLECYNTIMKLFATAVPSKDLK